jgi:hypothetical protein
MSRESHNAQIAKKIDELDHVENDDKQKRKTKLDAVMQERQEQTLTHALNKQIKTETNFLIGDILYGSRQNDPKKLKPTKADLKAMNNIFYKQRA